VANYGDSTVTKIDLNVVKTLAWVNTENSQVSVPTSSNGSTTLPVSVGLQYNGGTNLWRCLAVA
jgi:hypothetical protein